MTKQNARVGGIHHVTAIAGDPQENVDFYAGVLGMRMVKRSVNQDDPGTYHLFYADGGAHPGSDLTFFPWAHGAPGRNGTGITNEVVFAVPPGSLDYWGKRLAQHGVAAKGPEDRFGEPTLTFHDFHGLRLALTETEHALERPFDAWVRSPVPEEHQIRGIHAVRLVEKQVDPTAAFAQRVFGMEHVGSDGGWERYRGRDAWSGFLDVQARPDVPRGSWGVGTVHHVAWRALDDAEEVALQQAVLGVGISPTTVIDRFWFKSVYFREPGGVLFEIATDGPGFGVDEPMDKLGETLVLPPWLEPHREAIEAQLPPLRLPEAAVRRVA
ncbi:MAG TPA: ring-cleaving dioxygenase [Candidatus Thermoplasmatota archaeon]|nr:ring-cleaving dioxygenase [Candidatus Thermoplasmatota archaeon]